MKSGLRDRNNASPSTKPSANRWVSMKSGLRDRNNPCTPTNALPWLGVSMKSGLRDRNNPGYNALRREREFCCLNEVRS